MIEDNMTTTTTVTTTTTNASMDSSSGLTFGPAWLRHLSTTSSSGGGNDASKSAKHAYAREEMLAIYKTIEKQLHALPACENLLNNFHELRKLEVQKPISLNSPTSDEQKLLSTCVNSQLVLNSYNKSHQGSHGGSYGGGSGGGKNGSSQPTSTTMSTSDHRIVSSTNSIRNDRDGKATHSNSTRGGGGSTRRAGGGGGGGGGSGGYSSDKTSNSTSATDSYGRDKGGRNNRQNETGQYNETGKSKGSSTSSSSYSKRNNSVNWDDIETVNKKEYSSSKGANEDNWRSRANENEKHGPRDDNKDRLATSLDNRMFYVQSNSGSGQSKSSKTIQPHNSENFTKEPSINTNRQVNSTLPSQSDTSRNVLNNNDDFNDDLSEQEPEWLDYEPSDNDDEAEMTFDESGEYVAVKDSKVPSFSSSSSSAAAAAGKRTSADHQRLSKADSSSSERSSSNKSSSQSSQKSSPTLDSDAFDACIPKTNLESTLGHQNEISKNQTVNIQMSLSQLLASQSSENQSGGQNSESKPGYVAPDHPDADKWFYLDPQNQVQGPFSVEQMAAWSAAGYFSFNLMIKRGSDDKFVPLGALAANLGRLPFVTVNGAQVQPPQEQQQQQQQQQPQLKMGMQPQMPHVNQSQTPPPSGPRNLTREYILQQLQLYQQLQQSAKTTAINSKEQKVAALSMIADASKKCHANSLNVNDEFAEQEPEWLDYEPSENDDDTEMTFDESGEYVSVKDLKVPFKRALDQRAARVDSNKSSHRSQRPPMTFNEKSSPKTNFESNPFQNSKNQTIGGTRVNGNIQMSLSQLLASQSSENQSGGQNSESKPGYVAPDHPDADKWFYLDPQNQVQGPFSVEQMAAWSAAGYFSFNLMIKRGSDDKFVPLGALAANLGRLPFVTVNGAQVQPPQEQQQQQQQQQPQLKMGMQPQMPHVNQSQTPPPSAPRNLTREYILQQMQLYQQLQQSAKNNSSQHHHKNSSSNTANFANLIQQLQQIQLQKQASSSSPATATTPNVFGSSSSSNLNDIRLQQEALINQLGNGISNSKQSLNNNQAQRQTSMGKYSDPAIVDAALPPAMAAAANSQQTQSNNWAFGNASVTRSSPFPPMLQHNANIKSAFFQQQQQQQQQQQHNVGQNLNNQAMEVLNANIAALLANNPQLKSAATSQFGSNNALKEKLNVLIEQARKEEERRRKIVDSPAGDLAKDRDVLRALINEYHLKETLNDQTKEEILKEQAKKRILEEMARKQEEMRMNEELKKRIEEELKTHKLSQQHHHHQQQQQSDETEKKRFNPQLEQQIEMARKLAEFDRLRQRQQQQQQQETSMNVPPKQMLEQQALEEACKALLCQYMVASKNKI